MTGDPVELITAAADRRPHAPALVTPAGVLTHEELRLRWQHLAAEILVAVSGRGGGSVAVAVQDPADAVIAMLACLCAGTPMVMIDSRLPIAVQRHVVRDAGCTVALVDGVATFLPDLVTNLPCTAGDAVPAGMDAMPDKPAGVRSGPSAGQPDDLAYILYTSGSTGMPKGVEVSRGALADYLRLAVRTFEMRDTDRFLQTASLAFDVFVEETLPVLAVGGAVVTRPDTRPLAPDDVTEAVERHGVTLIELTLPYWLEWCRELEADGRQPPDCLRAVLVGGERMPLAAYRRWSRWRTPLIHVYGTAESLITNTVFRSGQPVPDAAESLPIGLPVEGNACYVRDDDDREVPVGGVGELYLAGFLATGYRNRPDETAQRFIRLTVAGRGSVPVFRTGDLVRRLEGGLLEFLGRRDAQEKIDGYRVEISGIEAILEQHPLVEKAMAIRTDRGGTAALVAWVQLRRGESTAALTAAETVRRYAAEHLAAWAVPSEVRVVTQWPLTTNGKVDRTALTAPPVAAGTAGGDGPDDPDSAYLSDLVSAVLGIADPPLERSFLELGGNSLLAMRLRGRVKRDRGISLPVSEILSPGPVRDLRQRLADAASPELDRGVV